MVVCEHVDRFMKQPTGPHSSIHKVSDLKCTLAGILQVNDTDFGRMMYNASLPWEELIHPWVTCARISLTRPMGDEVMQITRYMYIFFP